MDKNKNTKIKRTKIDKKIRKIWKKIKTLVYRI